ncbi:aconitase family protein [Defluviimonas sp. WL0075]|uniref:Aconitase family protein n=1 Tax=Albidovulum sediminicola TaxID=2984331 RepID=A0ABT2Z6Z8_9RHOB|nr:aconitase family protein [Defluviimonas sp. WL0075]MCV2866922.1 aconitase family protein [Defluviimonas sp. WL0075]
MTIQTREGHGLWIVEGTASGDILACAEGLSFWGGVDPATGRIVDVHHPDHGTSVSGKILMMPTSRGSCSGSGVLLELSMKGLAPAALVFCEEEEILTLGALVSARIFDRPVPTLRLPRAQYDRLASARCASIGPDRVTADGLDLCLEPVPPGDLDLSDRDRRCLNGEAGRGVRMAMEIICRMAAASGAGGLVDVTRGHIDGCILAHSANLIFAEKMAELGARTSIPTTINAISVDRENWPSQNVPPDFGRRASRLADAYVAMGARPVFTCAPYLLEDPPREGEALGWSESNAVIFANSVLGARTPKHPDYLDLFIAMTGRAPASGVYTEPGRVPRAVIAVDPPALGQDDLLWPLLGWLAGRISPEQVPLITGMESRAATRDDLKALCAAFGTTSGAPMLHVAGHTPEAHLAPATGAPRHRIGRAELLGAWADLNRGTGQIDLVAIGSPHASLDELRRIATLFDGRACGPGTQMIVTLGRDTQRAAAAEGLADRLAAAGVQLIPDICWCSITEPVFPPNARGLMTNSGKYAHYAHGLSGRHARLGSLEDCVNAAVTGRAPDGPPKWLRA